ncbi:MAG TPA: orotidine-5'-phosphate decarboxylase [Daejeonella sp.]|nr:orotidine-5'-phosphate decarboxylase [Daejeonella sp.]
MTRHQLISQINKKKSFLCIGLDTDITLIPKFLLDAEDPVYEFNKRIIAATHDLCVAYKPNSAFYESRGIPGWQSLIKTWQDIPTDCLSIIDAKRGDIGNTSAMYAKAFFEKESSGMSFDAITIAPYMGSDSVTPFLTFENKWVILLALTSNAGGKDFQLLENNNQHLYESVITKAHEWAGPDKLMFVVGATRAEAFQQIRKLAPDNFLLVPGVGAQGGNLQDVCQYGLNKDCGLLINASRSIIYASNGENFAERAREEALKIQREMAVELEKIGF